MTTDAIAGPEARVVTPVLSLWQPWATLWALGLKGPETRSWACPPALIGHRIGIHATRRLTPDALDLCLSEPFRATLLRALFGAPDQTLLGYPSPLADSVLRKRLPEALPLGRIIGTCLLTGCVRTDDVGILGAGDGNRVWVSHRVTEDEWAFGDYTDGRFAWVGEDFRPLRMPIPARGSQRVWYWEGPLEAPG